METFTLIGSVVAIVTSGILFTKWLRRRIQSKLSCEVCFEIGIPLSFFTNKGKDSLTYFGVLVSIKNICKVDVSVKACSFASIKRTHSYGDTFSPFNIERVTILAGEVEWLKIYGGDLLEHKRRTGSFPWALVIHLSQRVKPFYFINIDKDIHMAGMCRNWALVPQVEKERLMNKSRWGLF